MVEVLVALGFIGGLFLVLMSITDLGLKSERGLRLSIDFDVLSNSVATVLNNERLCSESLGGGAIAFDPASPVGVTEIRTGAGVLIASAGTPSNTGLRVTRMELSAIGSGNPIGGGLTQYPARLRIDAEKVAPGKENTILGGSKLQRDFLLVVQVDGAGKIQACHGEQSPTAAAEAACTAIGGVFSGGACAFPPGGTFAQNVCASLKGTFNAATGNCSLPAPPPAPPPAPATSAPSPPPASAPPSCSWVQQSVEGPGSNMESFHNVGCPSGQYIKSYGTQSCYITYPAMHPGCPYDSVSGNPTFNGPFGYSQTMGVKCVPWSERWCNGSKVTPSQILGWGLHVTTECCPLGM